MERFEAEITRRHHPMVVVVVVVVVVRRVKALLRRATIVSAIRNLDEIEVFESFRFLARKRHPFFLDCWRSY